MRCIGCGFENPVGTVNCVKCGQPLGGSSDTSESVETNVKNEPVHKPTVSDANSYYEANLRNTIIDVDYKVENGNEDNQNQVLSGSQNQCPNCKYPILDENATICPNCKIPLGNNQLKPTKLQHSAGKKSETAAVVCEKCKASIPGHFHYCPNCGSKLHQPTEWHGMRNIIAEEPLQKLPFSLTIMPDADEVLKIKECAFTCVENEFVVLNRENTDSENRSITSDKQAEIGFENGHWYLKNLSDNESTFIVANRKMEIQDGDVILLGYRYFKFNKK